MKFLVTGGCGFIGSHTVVSLLEEYKNTCTCVLVDNLDNSSDIVVGRIKQITQCKDEQIIFIEGDLCQLTLVEEIFTNHGPFDAILHFAGFKHVGESHALPLHYYFNNLVSTMNLLAVMKKRNEGKQNMVFSSSCTVYGARDKMPLTEGLSLGELNPIQPYGKTKLLIEHMLTDMHLADRSLNVCILRYFNPVGAHESGLIGEDPKGIPNNLFPLVGQVAIGLRKHVNVYGNDYATLDGTGVRDYIHVVDLAEAHVCAVKKILSAAAFGLKTYNIGTGVGSSVLQVINTMIAASSREIPFQFCERRLGDAPVAYCAPDLAAKELGWQSRFTLADACRDFWKWTSENPNGYEAEGGHKKVKLDKEEDKFKDRKALVFALLN